MAKDKFALLKGAAAQELQADSSLKENVAAKKPVKKKKDQMVYGISLELAEAVEAAGESLSGFAKRAMMKVAREEGII
jgi:hypothetical protein